MAFSNLFTNLCAVEGAVNDRRNDFNSRQETGSKRKAQSMQTGPYVKRQRLQPCAAGVSNAVRSEEPKAPEANRFNCNNPRPGVSRDGSYRHNERTFPSNDHCRGNTNNTRKKKKNKGKKKRERENSQRYNNVHRDQRDRNQDNIQPRKLFMSQEFKDQHSLEVDGRLLCIYFLRGRCIKGEECHFEHIEGYNGLIKEACKFYIQGFCLKGKNCPYLHETFPCKFFHTKGICRRDQCMFSHDPLTEITRKLLDNFIQRENELRKKAEEEALSRTENVSEAVEENTTVEIVVPTARPSFYQSSAVEADALMPDEEQPAEEDNTPQTQDDEEPEDSFPFALEQPEPVCYSVEAMLGPKLFKPCLYTAPKEESLAESKTSDNPLNVIDSSYSVANALDFSTTSSLLRSPTTAPAILATCGSSYKETSLILNDKYCVSPNVQEKTFKRPSSFYDSAASGYHTKEEASCGTLKKNRMLTIESSAPNSMPKDEKTTTEYKREYIPLMRNYSLSQKYIPLMGSNYQSPQIQNYKFGGGESYFKDKPAQSLKNSETVLDKTLPTNQVTSVEQNLKETNREMSLTNVDRITRVPVNGVFASLTPDVDQTSTVRSSVCGNTDIQSALKSESDRSASQKVNLNEAKMQSTWNISETMKDGCTSKNKREEIERVVRHPVKKYHGLFQSLTPGSDQTSTVCNSFRDKPPVPSTLKCGKSMCASLFTGNTSENTNSGKKSVSISETANSKDSKKEEDKRTSSTKSFQSLFSFTPDLDQTSTVCNSFSDKPAGPSAQKVEKSICDSQKVNCDPSQTLKPSPSTGNRPEGPNNSNNNHHTHGSAARIKTLSNNHKGLVSNKPALPSAQGHEKLNYGSNQATQPSQFTGITPESTNITSTTNHRKQLVSTSATSNVKCSKTEEDIESAKISPAKLFETLFTSLTPDSDQTSTVTRGLHDKPALQSGQKQGNMICASEMLKWVSNQTTNPCKFIDNRSESMNNCSTSTHSKFVSTSASANLKCSKKEEDFESAKTPPAKSFQSLFSSLTPDSVQPATVKNSLGKKTAAPSTQKVEKSICDSQIKSKTLSKNAQTFVSPCAKSDLKSKNQQEDVESVETPRKSFHCLFASLTPDSDLISATPSAQKVEKCADEKVRCGPNKATTPNETTGNTSRSTTNSNRSNHSNSNSLKGSKKDDDIESAKSFQSLFTSLTPDSDHTSTTSTISHSFSDNPIVPNVQKVEKCTSHGQKVVHDSNQAKKATVLTSFRNSKNFGAAGSETLCKNGQKFVYASVMSDLKSKNQKVNDETVETPVESSIFGCLTTTLNNSVKSDVLSVDYVEKSICDGQKDNFDSNPVKFTTKQSHFPKKNLSESTNNGGRSHGEVTKTLSNNDQKLVSPSAMSNLKSKNKDDTDDDKTSPVKSFQSLFTNLTPEVDQTFHPQRDEKSICDSQMFKCDSSQATKQSQFNESTTGSKEGNRDMGIAHTKSSLNLFSAPLSKSAATNNSVMPCLPEPSHFPDDKLLNAKRTSSPVENKRTEENKYGPKRNSATVNSPKVSNKSHPSPPPQSNNGPPNSILKSLFQQLRPYEQQEQHHVGGKSNTHPLVNS